MVSDMTEDEAEFMVYRISEAIRGEHVTVICRDARAMSRQFDMCVRLCDEMGLAFAARRAVGRREVVIGDTMRDGGIDFRTADTERMSCGDERGVRG